MKNVMKKVIAYALVASMCLSILCPAKVFATELNSDIEDGSAEIQGKSGFDENAHGEVIKEGYCGTNYKLYEDETLYIYGNYGITARSLSNSYFLDESVSDVYIEDGVTGIGEKSFYECKDIRQVRIPESIKNIGWC